MASLDGTGMEHGAAESYDRLAELLASSGGEGSRDVA